MIPTEWTSAVDDSADPVRARRRLARLREAAGARPLAAVPAGLRPVIAAVLAGSGTLSDWLIRDPDMLDVFGDADGLRSARRKEGLARDRDRCLEGLDARTEAGAREASERLHASRRRNLLRIAARDLGRLGTLPEITLELSNAADVFLEGLLRIVRDQATARWGHPWHASPGGTWYPTGFAVLGLGKHGGQELNYSSDVDLMFVYADEGFTFRTKPRRRSTKGEVVSNHVFFRRLCEALIHEATGRGVDAGGLRIDMRLRPEGDSGPLARSLDSYENFYAAWGQTWERMMLLKARGVAGDMTLAGEFLERIQPFRYPRSPGEGLLREMADMKARIEKEVVRAGELDRNVKLGRGGIRDIEFVVQALQVLYGGRNPFVQTAQTLTGLVKLASYHVLPEPDAAFLHGAYPFLRDVEHRLQMEEHLQTHTLPTAPAARTRLARLMGFPTSRDFDKVLSDRRGGVRAIYDRIFGAAATQAASEAVDLPGDFDRDHAGWISLLAAHRFRDPEQALRSIRVLLEGPGFGHVSPRTRELGRRLVPRLLDLCPRPAGPTEGSPASETPEPPAFLLSDPDRVLTRLDTFIATYGARSSLYELWNACPIVLENLLKLFDRSEFLAELAIRSPDLVEELESGGHVRRAKTAHETLADLRHGIHDPDQHLWIRRYFQTEFMRLGLRDILGLVDSEAASRELTALAEACVEYALEVVTRRDGRSKPPFAVVALGKFGGSELVYGSDLDVLFVAPDGARALPELQRIAAEMVDLLTARTELGSVFQLDTRLRPDGEKGLRVNVLGAYETYYRRRARLWEIQALTRARHVAGHAATGEAFLALARKLTDFASPSLPLAAFRPDWKTEIARMRHRIEFERTPSGKEALAFKTGAGGLIDVEFLAQACALEHGWFEPNTLASLGRARDTGALPGEDADRLVENYRRLHRMESILRRWSFEGEAVLPDDPDAQYRVAVRCGYPDARSFLEDVANWRAAIRAVYLRHLEG